MHSEKEDGRGGICADDVPTTSSGQSLCQMINKDWLLQKAVAYNWEHKWLSCARSDIPLEESVGGGREQAKGKKWQLTNTQKWESIPAFL